MASEAEAILSEMPHPLHILARAGWRSSCPLAAIFLAFLGPQSFLAASDNGRHWCDRLTVERNALWSISARVLTPSLFHAGLKSDFMVSREAFLQIRWNKPQMATMEGLGILSLNVPWVACVRPSPSNLWHRIPELSWLDAFLSQEMPPPRFLAKPELHFYFWI